MGRGRVPLSQEKQEQIRRLRKEGRTYVQIAQEANISFSSAHKYSHDVIPAPFSLSHKKDGSSRDIRTYRREYERKRTDIVDSLLVEFFDIFGCNEHNDENIKKFISILRKRGEGERKVNYFFATINKRIAGRKRKK
jgi:hypothetical protein